MAQDGRTGLVMEHECNSEALTDDDVSMMVNNLNRACALAADPMRYRGMQASFLTIHPTNIYLSIYRSISLSVCLSICISICLCLSMYVCMYVCMMMYRCKQWRHRSRSRGRRLSSSTRRSSSA